MTNFMSTMFPLDHLQEYMQTSEGWTFNTISTYSWVILFCGLFLFGLPFLWYTLVQRKRYGQITEGIAFLVGTGVLVSVVGSAFVVYQAQRDYAYAQVAEVVVEEIKGVEGIRDADLAFNGDKMTWGEYFMKKNEKSRIEFFTDDGARYEYTIWYMDGDAYIHDGTHYIEEDAPEFSDLQSALPITEGKE